MKNFDKVVIELQEKLELKKKNLIPVKRLMYTNCAFKLNGVIKNLNAITDINVLISIHAFLLNEKKNFNESCSMLGLEGYLYKYENFTFHEWEQDIQTRVDTLIYNKNKKEYELIEQRLLNLESDEIKKGKELEAIMNLLK